MFLQVGQAQFRAHFRKQLSNSQAQIENRVAYRKKKCNTYDKTNQMPVVFGKYHQIPVSAGIQAATGTSDNTNDSHRPMSAFVRDCQRPPEIARDWCNLLENVCRSSRLMENAGDCRCLFENVDSRGENHLLEISGNPYEKSEIHVRLNKKSL